MRRNGLVELLMHPVAELGGRLVEDVPPEVYTEDSLGVMSLPYETREGGLQRLAQPLMRVARISRCANRVAGRCARLACLAIWPRAPTRKYRYSNLLLDRPRSQNR